MRARRLAGLLLLVSLWAGTARPQSSATPVDAAASTPGTVLVLIPVQQGRPMFDLLARGVASEFLRAPGRPVALSFEHLYDLLDAPGLGERQAAFLKDKYAGQRIDAIIGLGNPQYATVRERLGLDSRVPLILLGSGRTARPPHAVTITLTGSVYDSYAWARPLFPPDHRVALLGGAAAMDRRTNDAILRELQRVPGRDRVVDLSALDLGTMKRRVAEQPSGTVFLVGSVLAEPDGRPLTYPMLMSAVGEAARGPIVTVNDLLLGQGALGGALYRVEDVGAQAAALALRVLRGTPVDAIAPVQLAPTPIVDARVMARYDLPLDRLPRGTTVLWQEPSLWQAYRGWFVGGVTVVLVQAALIVGLLAERRRRHESQRKLAERLDVQALVAAISSGFANLPGDGLDAQIVSSLERVGTALGAESCALFVVESGHRLPRLVCRWPAIDLPATAEPADDALLTWAWPRLERGEELDLHAGITLPAHVRRQLGKGAHRAFLLLPLQVDERVVAVLVLRHVDSPAWTDHVVGDLRTIGEIIATAVVRKRTDATMRQQLETLAHVNRVASLGELAASLAHELNQPLGAILNNAEVAQVLLQRPTPPLDLLREIVADVIADDERAGGIIRNMRSMLRRHDVEVGPIDVNAVAIELTRLVAHDARLRGGSLDVALGDGLPLVAIDPTQLQQVLLNLVVNAVDAMASLHVRRPVELRTEAADRGVRIEVRDYGPGVPTDVLPHLFDPFFTTKPSGLGVGLAITRSIVEAAGGRIEGANAPGGGAVFRVWLPAARVATAGESEHVRSLLA